MSNVTRKDFLGLGALLAGAIGLPKLAGARPSGTVPALPGMAQKGGGIDADIIV